MTEFSFLYKEIWKMGVVESSNNLYHLKSRPPLLFVLNHNKLRIKLPFNRPFSFGLKTSNRTCSPTYISINPNAS